MRPLLLLFLSLAALALPGCADDARMTTESYAPALAKSEPPAGIKVEGGGERSAPADAPAKSVPRKILYTATVDLSVDDAARVGLELDRLARSAGGYIAESDLSGQTGGQRSGRWKLRVPVDRFDGFVDSVAALGEVVRRAVDSQDVTEEFYDLDARVASKKVEETRLLKHLTDSTGNLKDILEVERELARVRSEVERMQGRLKLLANLADLTTVTVTAAERGRFVPVQAPGFASRVSRRFSSSLDQLRRTVENAAIEFVAFLPWLPIWLVVAAILWLFRRRLRRRPAPGPAV